MPVYAVTGASGHAGRYAVHQLLARGLLLGALIHRPRRVKRGSLQPLREGGQAVTSARAGAASYQQRPTYFGR